MPRLSSFCAFKLEFIAPSEKIAAKVSSRILVLFIDEIQDSLHVLTDFGRRSSKVTVHEGEYQCLATSCDEVSAKTMIIAEGTRLSEDIWLRRLIIVLYRSGLPSYGKQLKQSFTRNVGIYLFPESDDCAWRKKIVPRKARTIYPYRLIREVRKI